MPISFFRFPQNLSDAASHPIKQRQAQGVTSVRVTSLGFLEAELLCWGSRWRGQALPRHAPLAPPSRFCYFSRVSLSTVFHLLLLSTSFPFLRRLRMPRRLSLKHWNTSPGERYSSPAVSHCWINQKVSPIVSEVFDRSSACCHVRPIRLTYLSNNSIVSRVSCPIVGVTIAIILLIARCGVFPYLRCKLASQTCCIIVDVCVSFANAASLLGFHPGYVCTKNSGLQPHDATVYCTVVCRSAIETADAVCHVRKNI